MIDWLGFSMEVFLAFWTGFFLLLLTVTVIVVVVNAIELLANVL